MDNLIFLNILKYNSKIMQKIKSFKEILDDGIIMLAIKLCWEDCENKDSYISIAKKIRDKELAALALKCTKEAEKAMSKKDYISHLDYYPGESTPAFRRE